MADDIIGLNEPAGPDVDKNLDCEVVTFGVAPTSRYRERLQIAGALALEIAAVLNTTPAGTEYSLLVRQVGPTPAGTSNIGDVDVLTLPAVSQATAANLNAEVQGDAAHDAAATGNPLLCGGSHETPADTAPTNRLATVTDGDATRLSAVDGALFVITTGPQSWQTVNLGTLTGATVKATPGAGLSLYVTGVTFSIGAATASSIKLTISAGADIWGPHYLEAINGRGVARTFPTPLKVTANTALLATSTGSATATLNVEGFTAPG